MRCTWPVYAEMLSQRWQILVYICGGKYRRRRFSPFWNVHATWIRPGNWDQNAYNRLWNLGLGIYIRSLFAIVCKYIWFLLFDDSCESGLFFLIIQVRLPPEVNRILYIKNLPYKITAEEMYDIFGKYGAIRQIRM